MNALGTPDGLAPATAEHVEALPTIRKFGITLPVAVEDWVCVYCPRPLGTSAVTTPGGFAHRECDPIFRLLEAELLRMYEGTADAAR